MEQQWTNAREQEQTNMVNLNTLPGNTPPPAPRGWMMWVAMIVTLLGLVIAGAAWLMMIVSLIAPYSIGQTVLVLVFLAPIVGGLLSLPGVIFSLLATRQTHQNAARITLPVSLVGVATFVLVAGLLFGGLVVYPRYQLGLFAQQIQKNCNLTQQLLGKYKNENPLDLVAQATEITATIEENKQTLQADEAALNALTPPDNPAAQQLLSDCRTAVSATLGLPDLLKNPAAGALQIPALFATYLDAQQVGNQLAQELFSPFLPPPNLLGGATAGIG